MHIIFVMPLPSSIFPSAPKSLALGRWNLDEDFAPNGF